MKLHSKLMLATTVPVILTIIGIIWFAFDQLAADYFMVLMDKYMVSPTETHRAFLSAVHRYLLWASLLALLLASLLSYLLTRRILAPLRGINSASRRIAAGDFSARVSVQNRDEIGELGVAFNRMGDSLESLEGLRKAMVADVAHELRTPLTNLRGYLEGLSDGVIPPEPQTFAMLLRENLRLVSLVEGLGQLARADAARAYLNLQSISPAECLREILSLYGMNLADKGIRVTTHLDETIRLTADLDKLLQAIRNLVENCWKYTPIGGWVEISCFQEGDAATILFSNNGAAIADADLPLLFERFYTPDPSRSRATGGAGIGLAIVKQLVTAHGGEVGARSDNDRIDIWLRLPIHPPSP